MALVRLQPSGPQTVEEMAQGWAAQPVAAKTPWLTERLAGWVASPHRPVADLVRTKRPIARLDLELDLKWLRSSVVETTARGWPVQQVGAKAPWLTGRPSDWLA